MLMCTQYLFLYQYRGYPSLGRGDVVYQLYLNAHAPECAIIRVQSLLSGQNLVEYYNWLLSGQNLVNSIISKVYCVTSLYVTLEFNRGFQIFQIESRIQHDGVKSMVMMVKSMVMMHARVFYTEIL